MSKITFIKGDIFQTKMSSMVCPVNSYGIMGAGLAKVWRDAYDNKSYTEACRRGEVSPGTVIVRQPAHAYKDTDKTLIYMATKLDYRDDSKLEWIEQGLMNLFRAINYYNLPSVAIPAVGCGCGNLPWSAVQIMIKGFFEGDNQNREIEVYEPFV